MSQGRSEKLQTALSPRNAWEVVVAVLGTHCHMSMLGGCSCAGADYDDQGPYDGELASHDRHQSAAVAAELIRLYLAIEAVTVDDLAAEVQRALGAHRRDVAPARCSCGIRYDQTDLFEGGRNEHDAHAAAVIIGQLQVRGMIESTLAAPVAPEAIAAALKAMEGVTPPPGISKDEWLKTWGRSALVAGGVAAALQAMEVLAAATTPDPARQAGEALDGHRMISHPYAATGMKLSCMCGALLDDADLARMSPHARFNLHLGRVMVEAGWRPGKSGDTVNRAVNPFRVDTHP